jgi:uncharacterized protein
MANVAQLAEWYRSVPRVLLGYSGGVDSSVLAVVGARSKGPGAFLAVLGRSPSLPEAQWVAAGDLANRYGVPVLEVDTNELADPSYRANQPDRCYFCKRELWTVLRRVATERGYDVVIDGTHADDLREHRPGARAGDEQRIRSPLAELGWGKATVRAAARELGLPVWDAPAAPCLSSRVRYGLEVTTARLAQVERAESFLRSLGVTGDLRVRHWGDTAKIEVNPEMFPLVDEQWSTIADTLGELGFASVERDRQGYRRGSLLPIAS